MLSYIINTDSNPVAVKNVSSLDKQLFIQENSVLLAKEDKEVFSSTKSTIIDELTWSTNDRSSVQIRIVPMVNGVPKPMSEINNEGGMSYGMFAEQLNTHGSLLFDFIEYDTVLNKYKLILKKPLQFAEGVRITFRSIATTAEFKCAYTILGRSHD